VNRVVRVTEDFWAALDLALPAESRPGTPSPPTTSPDHRSLATGWDDLPQQIPPDDYRIHIDAGRTVAVYAVEAQMANDGAVELVAITTDVVWPRE